MIARRRFMRAHRRTGARLSPYLDGELEPRDRRLVEEHVHRCPECRRVLATLRRTLEGLLGLRGLPQTSVAPGVIDRLRREGSP
jgi:anti-sigma factor RsiW